MKGFDAKWCRWIQDFITRGSVGIKVQVNGLIPHLVDGGVSILQCADDTIIFLDHDLEKALNMKLILCFLEQLSGS
jgi:hypothetical protein